MAHINKLQTELNLMEQTILMKAFKNDDDDVLYNWMKYEYRDVGDVVMNSLINKYKVQEMATDDELKWVEHLYNCYVNEYLREKNGLNRVFF